jgi:hypothetical protein
MTSLPDSAPDDGLKLFVIGTSSANPDDWSIWDELKLVIAHNPEEAIKVADTYPQSVHEVVFDKPKLLVSETEPNWGEDL